MKRKLKTEKVSVAGIKREIVKRPKKNSLVEDIYEYLKKQSVVPCQLQVKREKIDIPTEKINRWTVSVRKGNLLHTLRSEEPQPLHQYTKSSVIFWTDHDGQYGHSDKSSLLCTLPWTVRVNKMRRKVWKAMESTGQSPDIIVRFLQSQLMGRVVAVQQQQQLIDFRTMVLDFFGKSSLAKVLLTHMLKQKKPKKFGFGPNWVLYKHAYKNSCIYWHTGGKKGPLLCETTEGTNLVVKCFAALPDNDDTKARFAMSQLVGYPVQSWLDVIDHLPQLQLDVSMVPGNQTMSTYSGGVVEASLFVLVKKMLRIPNLPAEPNPLQIIQDQLGMDTYRRCFYVDDVSAPTFAQAHIALPKLQENFNLEYLFKENIRSTSFYISLLSNIAKGPFEVQLAEDIVVGVRLVNHRNIPRYLCLFVRKSSEYNLPSEVSHHAGIQSSKILTTWAFKVMQWYAEVGGTLKEMVEMYQEHAWFCIWDLKAATFEASHVYASDAYVQQFGPQENMYHVFGESGYSTHFIWKGVLQPILQGKNPCLHHDVCDKDGKIHTYILRYFRSKSKRFYVLVVEEKYNYNLPSHLENQRKELDGLGSSVLSVVKWSWQVLKWFYRPSSSLITLKQVQSRYTGMYLTTDLSQSTFETSLHYSDEFVHCFDNIVRLSASIKSTRNSMHVMWNVVLLPMWSGRIPEVERDIQCKDGGCRTFTITFYTDASKQFYTAVIVEKTPEIDATDALVGSVIEEEVPTDFGEYDVREFMHKTLRTFKGYPTEVSNPKQCQEFLEKLVQVHGPESNTKMFTIHDMHVADWLQSLVYRSPQASEYYGDYTTIMQRVKTNTLTFGNFLPRLYQFLTGTFVEDDKIAMVLRVNDVEVDTVRIDIIQDARYLGCVITIVSTKRYRPPKMQDWDSLQEDSQDDTGWNLLKLFS